jgi:hypothetical protein
LNSAITRRRFNPEQTEFCNYASSLFSLALEDDWRQGMRRFAPEPD